LNRTRPGGRTVPRGERSPAASSIRCAITLARDDPFWLFATEGEAALLQHNYDDAYTFYRKALEQPTAEVQHVQAAYHQICRLWHVLDKDQVSRLVD